MPDRSCRLICNDKGCFRQATIGFRTFARIFCFSTAIGTADPAPEALVFQELLKQSDASSPALRPCSFLMTTLIFGLPTQIGMSYGLQCFPKRGIRLFRPAPDERACQFQSIRHLQVINLLTQHLHPEFQYPTYQYLQNSGETSHT